MTITATQRALSSPATMKQIKRDDILGQEPPKKTRPDFGQILDPLIQDLGVTQRQVAWLCSVNRSALSQDKKRLPSHKLLYKYRDFIRNFNVRYEYLLTGSGPMFNRFRPDANWKNIMVEKPAHNGSYMVWLSKGGTLNPYATHGVYRIWDESWEGVGGHSITHLVGYWSPYPGGPEEKVEV